MELLSFACPRVLNIILLSWVVGNATCDLEGAPSRRDFFIFKLAISKHIHIITIFLEVGCMNGDSLFHLLRKITVWAALPERSAGAVRSHLHDTLKR